MSPRPLALHPCLDLNGFRVLSNSDSAPISLFVFCTRLFRDWALPGGFQAMSQFVSRLYGCKICVWVWLEPLMFLRWMGLAGRLGSLLLLVPCRVWIWACLEASSCFRSTLESGTRFGCGSGSRPLVLFSQLCKGPENSLPLPKTILSSDWRSLTCGERLERGRALLSRFLEVQKVLGGILKVLRGRKAPERSWVVVGALP